jgi:hypothetical protein
MRAKIKGRALTRPGKPQTPDARRLVCMLPERWDDLTLIMVYDLREAFEKARSDRERWGRERTSVYPLDVDHVAVVFHRSDEGREAREMAA